MLTIRNEQLRALERESRRQFEERLAAHARRFFPNVCGQLGEEETARAVSAALDRAASYGIVTERGAAKFLNLMFTFGRDFDGDQLLPWASGILRGRLPAEAKIEKLYAEALRHEGEARGFFS